VSQFVLDGVSFYMNHSVPNQPLYYYLDPGAPESEIEHYYEDIRANIMITGHTHIPVTSL
jgi:predicted phosphodiesterase